VLINWVVQEAAKLPKTRGPQAIMPALPLVGGLSCNLDLQFDRSLVVIDLGDVHGKGTEPADALRFRPSGFRRRNLFQQFDEQRIETERIWSCWKALMGVGWCVLISINLCP
jgi:hypothetical protein